MRHVTKLLLLAYVFVIPWEYSLDFGTGIGDIARIVGLATLLCAVPAILQCRSMRTPGHVQWLTLIVFLWFCCTLFWSLNADATVAKLRGYFQELMIVWLLWEFVSTESELRDIFRYWLAGSWTLAVLTAISFANATAANQIRFAPLGQDPNDVARYLDLALPIAAYLLLVEGSWLGRLFALSYFPLALAAIVFTASRAGVLVACVSLLGAIVLLVRRYPSGLAATSVAVVGLLACLWMAVPNGTFARLATAASQLQGGDLNQRTNIWHAGLAVFNGAPFAGYGAGTFTEAAGLSPIDTAHNAALAVAVEGGLIALALGVAVVLAALFSASRARQPLRGALYTALATWFCLSMVGTTEESRKTWLLFAVMAVAGRLAENNPSTLRKAASLVRPNRPPLQQPAGAD